jgi:hypothetical protein
MAVGNCFLKQGKGTNSNNHCIFPCYLLPFSLPPGPSLLRPSFKKFMI